MNKLHSLFVEFVDFPDVAEDDILFPQQRGRRLIGRVVHLVQIDADAELEVLDVGALCLQQLGHDEPAVTSIC